MKQYKISVSWKGQVLDSIIMGLCKTQQTSRAIDFLAYMVENGCKPTEATYNILVKGITCEGLPEEASKLWSELQSKGLVKKSLVEKMKSQDVDENINYNSQFLSRQDVLITWLHGLVDPYSVLSKTKISIKSFV